MAAPDDDPGQDPLAPNDPRKRIGSAAPAGDNYAIWSNRKADPFAGAVDRIFTPNQSPMEAQVANTSGSPSVTTAHGTAAWSNPAPAKTDIGSSNPNDAYGVPKTNSGVQDRPTPPGAPSLEDVYNRVKTLAGYEDVPKPDWPARFGLKGGNQADIKAAIARNAQRSTLMSEAARVYQEQSQAQSARTLGTDPQWEHYVRTLQPGQKPDFGEFNRLKAGAAQVRADNPQVKPTAQIAKGPDGKLHYIMTDNTLSQYEAAPTGLENETWAPGQVDPTSGDIIMTSNRGNIKRTKGGIPGAPTHGIPQPNATQMTDDQVSAYVQGVQNQTLPPPTNYILGRNPKLGAALAVAGVDVAQYGLDYDAKKKVLSSLNSTPQVRLRQAVQFADQSTTKLEGLYDQLVRMGAITESQPLTRAVLETAKRLPGEAGKWANVMDAEMSHLTAELATVYQGGGTPTEKSMQLAEKSLNSAWNEQTFREGAKQVHLDLANRRASISDTNVVGGQVAPGIGNRAPASASSAQPQGGKSQQDFIAAFRKTRGQDPTPGQLAAARAQGLFQ